MTSAFAIRCLASWSPARPGSPAAICSICWRATARTSSPGIAPERRVRSDSERRRWEAVDLLDRRAVRDGDSARSGRPPCITAPAPRTSAGRGIDRRPTFAVNVPRHASPARGACARGPRIAACWCRARRWSTAPAAERADRGASARAGQPLRPEQAGAGNARRCVVSDGWPRRSRSRARSITSARGRIRRLRPPASRDRSPRSKPAGASRRSSSATSTRGAK